MLSDEIKKVEIDEVKLQKLKGLIIEAERENIKTKDLSNSDMVNRIKNLIEKEVVE